MYTRIYAVLADHYERGMIRSVYLLLESVVRDEFGNTAADYLSTHVIIDKGLYSIQETPEHCLKMFQKFLDNGGV